MSMSNIKTQYSVKQKLKDSSKVLESEIKIDKGRGLDTKKQEEMLSNMKSNIENINGNIADGLKSINKETSKKNEDSDKEVSKKDGEDKDSHKEVHSKNKRDSNQNEVDSNSDNDLAGNFLNMKS